MPQQEPTAEVTVERIADETLREAVQKLSDMLRLSVHDEGRGVLDQRERTALRHGSQEEIAEVYQWMPVVDPTGHRLEPGMDFRFKEQLPAAETSAPLRTLRDLAEAFTGLLQGYDGDIALVHRAEESLGFDSGTAARLCRRYAKGGGRWGIANGAAKMLTELGQRVFETETVTVRTAAVEASKVVRRAPGAPASTSQPVTQL